MTDEDHNTDGLDCWCCPEYHDADGEITRRQAEEMQALDIPVVIVHRSEVKGTNDATGDIPWQT